MPLIRKVSHNEVEAYWEQDIEYLPQSLSVEERERLLMTLSDRRGISRIDHKATHSWFARMYPAGLKQGVGKSFSDGVYGGPEAALQAAVQWRDYQQARIPKTTRKKGPRIRRLECGRQIGYLAWNRQRQRRYFAVGQVRNWDEARENALRWAGLYEGITH